MGLVCDWLTGMRGGERCLEAVCELYPDADIFTLVHIPGSVSKTIESHRIHTSYIQRLPGNIKTFRRYLPLFPHAIRQFDLTGYDCILSFSHCVAKGVKTPPSAPHICYCHTPMRYAWYMRDVYLSKLSWLKRFPADYELNLLKKWDRKTSVNVTDYIANSENVRRRIKECYGRDSVVIYPPVDCERFALCSEDDDYYLIVSALVAYKRIDLAVKAFQGFDRNLIIIGDGPELRYLRGVAGGNTRFLNSLSDNRISKYIQKCTALVFPGEEDFGIVPLEAQSCGKAVIAFGKGGVLETVWGLDTFAHEQLGPTGVFFYEQSVAALRQAILEFEERRGEINPQACRENALRFDRSVYKRSIQNCIQSITAATASLKSASVSKSHPDTIS